VLVAGRVAGQGPVADRFQPIARFVRRQIDLLLVGQSHHLPRDGALPEPHPADELANAGGDLELAGHVLLAAAKQHGRLVNLEVAAAGGSLGDFGLQIPDGDSKIRWTTLHH
jgi:hypothetical protein